MMRNKFTLIELLVVVAILGILTSILLPSLGQARRKAYQAICTNNEKQLGLATQMYTDSNDGWYMGNLKDEESDWSAAGLSGPRDTSSWHYKLRDSLNLTMKDKGQYKEVIPNILQCPMEPDPYSENDKRTYSSYQFTKRKGNDTDYLGIVCSDRPGSKRQDTIAYPVETVAATEKYKRGYINIVGGSTALSADYNLFEGAVDYSPLIYPHKQDHMQVLWVDGHVKITNRMTIFDTAENSVKSNPQGTMWDSDRE